MKNKNIFVKVLALALAFALAFSCAASFADEISVGNLEYAVIGDSAEDGGKIMLDAIGEGSEEIYREGPLGSTITTGDIVAAEGAYDQPLEIKANLGAVTVITENVTNENSSRPAVRIETGSDDAEVTLTTGDIKSDGDGIVLTNRGGTIDATTGSIDAYGIGVHYGEEELTTDKPDWNPGSTTLTVNGDINVTPNDEDAEFPDAGVLIQEKAATADTLVVNGDITVEGGEGKTALGVGVVTPGDAAVEVNGKITVNGDVSAGVALANDFSEDGSSGTITATLTGDIEVNGTRVNGVTAYSENGGTAELDMEGNITVTGEEEEGYAAAFDAVNMGGTIQADITGNLESTGIGISMMDSYEDNFFYGDYENYDGTVEADENEKYKTIDDDGGAVDVYRHVEDDTVIYYLIDGETGEVEEAWTLKFDEEKAGETAVRITGDVTAGESGAVITLENDSSKMDLIVDGTLAGETQSVLLSTDTISDNLTVTVWEIKENAAGNLVERVVRYDEDGEAVTEGDADTEKKIQYIIKIEPTQTDIISTNGTTEYEGYNVALEGDTVTLKLNIPEGYEVLNAFNGTDEKVELLQDENGDYYLVVPRGGAVMLSVELGKKEEPVTPVNGGGRGGAKLEKAIVVIDLNGGALDGQTGTITVETYVGKEIDLPGVPEREGYEFVGWNVQEVAQDDPAYKAPDENAAVQAAGSKLRVMSADVTVTAVWKKK